MVTLSVTPTQVTVMSDATSTTELVGVPQIYMEPATRIERATCGLRIVPDPTSDNVNAQETTTQEVGEMGLDGGSLSCPGSSVVADDPE
jgi:hypothetical protein